MGYRGNYPANIESPYRVFFQYSNGIDWDWSSGRYPTGKEDGWIWEEKFIPVPHRYGGMVIGPHKFMRIKIGSGKWSMPIKIVGEDGQDAEDIEEPEEWVQTTTNLEYYDLSDVSDGYRVGVFGNESIYSFDEDSGQDPDGEDIIMPANYDGDGRWIKVNTTSLSIATQDSVEAKPMTVNTKAVSPAILQHWLDYNFFEGNKIIESRRDSSGYSYLVSVDKNTAYNKDFSTNGNATTVARDDHSHPELSDGSGINTFTYDGTSTAVVSVDFSEVAHSNHLHDGTYDNYQSFNISDGATSTAINSGDNLVIKDGSNVTVTENDGTITIDSSSTIQNWQEVTDQGNATDNIVYPYMIQLTDVDWYEIYNTGEEYPYDAEVYNGGLYLVTGSNGKVFEYDGSSWNNIYTSNEPYLYVAEEYNDKLFVGAENGLILEYDGSNWSESYNDGTNNITSLEEYNGNLYAATSNNGLVLKHDGSTWTQIFDANDLYLKGLQSYNGKLYVGTVNDLIIYEYDGNSFQESTTLPSSVNDFTVYKGKLYAGCGNGKVYKYDGISWIELYDTGESGVYSLEVYRNNLYVGTQTNGIIFKYNGNDWTQSYNSSAYVLYTMKSYNGKLYAFAGLDTSDSLAGSVFEYGETFDFFNNKEKPIENQYHYWTEKNEFKEIIDGTATDVINKTKSLGMTLSGFGQNIDIGLPTPVFTVDDNIDGWTLDRATMGFTQSGTDGTTEIDVNRIDHADGTTYIMVSGLTLYSTDTDGYVETTTISDGTVNKGDRIYSNLVTVDGSEMQGVSLTLTFSE